MNMPLVWDKTSLSYSKKVHPIELSVYQSLTPLSTANMTLPEYESVSLLDMVLISTPDGKQESYRVASVTTNTDTKFQDVYLEHCACIMGDYVIPEDETITGTISQVLAKCLTYQTEWSAGTVSATSTIYAMIGGMTVLDAINDMMTQIPAYQAVFVGGENNWHVDIIERPTAPVCEARLSRNIENCEISYSSQGLCTRIVSSGLTGGHMDSANIQEMGVHAETMMLNDNLNQSQKDAIAQAYLAAHSEPGVSVSISGLELCKQTGLTLDRFDVGVVCRLTLPEMNVVVNEVIVDKRYADIISEPESVTFTLANAVPDLSISVAQAMKASGAGGGRSANMTAAKEVKEEHKRYETKFEQTDQYFRMLATDSEWQEIEGKWVQNITAYSQIVQTADNIQHVVTQTGSVTNEFDPKVSYHIGDRVLHGGVAYKFTKDHLGTPGNPIGWIGTGENGDVIPVENLYSQIDQTSDSVSSVIGQTGVVTEVFSPDKLYAQGRKVLYNGVPYEFTTVHQPGPWIGTDAKIVPTMASQITQNATDISAKVSQGDLQGYLQINALSTELGNVLDNGTQQLAAKITTLINTQEGTSKVQISADQIDLQGYVTADQIFVQEGGTITSTLYAENLQVDTDISVEGDLLMSGTSIIETAAVECETVTANTYYVGDDTTDLTDGIKEITLTGPDANDMYTLSATTLSGKPITIGNFSRAASQGGTTVLNGVWGGSTYTVTAAPQGETWTINFDPQTTSDATWATELGTGTVNANNNKWLDFPLYIGSHNPSGQMTRSVTINKSINATAIFSEGQKDVTPTINPAGWRWHEVSGDTVLDNTVTAKNPYNANNDQSTTVTLPTLSVSVTNNQVIVNASDGTVSGVVATASHTKYADGQASVVPTFAAFTGTPGSTAQELSPGTYEFKVTKDGSVTTDEFYTVPTAPTPPDPKVSRGNWANGSLTFTAGTTGSDNLSVKIWEGATDGSLDSATTPTKISFDIYEDTGNNTKTDTGADIYATVSRSAASLSLGVYDSTNNKFTVSKSSGGSVTVGNQVIQVGVTPLDIPVTIGSNVIGDPHYEGDGVYSLSATGTITVGSQGLTVSGTDTFTATDAIALGLRQAGENLTVSLTNQPSYDSAINVPEVGINSNGYYFVKIGSTSYKKFHAPSGGSGSSDRTATFLNPITLSVPEGRTRDDFVISASSIPHYENPTSVGTEPTSVQIDAWDIYQAGVSAGTGATVDVVKGDWELSIRPPNIGNLCTFRPSIGTGETASVLLRSVPQTKSKDNATATANVSITDYGQGIFSVVSYLVKGTNDYAGYVYLTTSQGSVTDSNILAKIPVDGVPGADSRYISTLSPIKLTSSDISTSTKETTATFDIGDPQTNVPISIDASDVYTKGLTDGSRLNIEELRTITQPLTQNTSYTFKPSDYKDVMRAIKFSVNVPPVYRRAESLAQTIVLPSNHTGIKTVTGNTVEYDEGPDTGNFSVVIDASNVWQAGFNEGAGAEFTATKVNVQGAGPYSATIVSGNGVSFNRYGYDKLYYYDDDQEKYVACVDRAKYWFYTTANASGGAYYQGSSSLSYYKKGYEATYYVRTE